jgi:hypothetical protein
MESNSERSVSTKAEYNATSGVAKEVILATILLEVNFIEVKCHILIKCDIDLSGKHTIK